ncbi:S-layer homology domain-containing protein [Paenibacillus planticolens]|uniref:SLH domain-containing protein n=1 Tax=Paenibacillus planticolens TaxID=2654976 RepID=A0ABX1ZY29_9BACL|nr:S-layer homology domain-containing protein [Paenibacillus planticolens]NOV03693.1 hypothetical protein [Paenibacillus planticolens]
MKKKLSLIMATMLVALTVMPVAALASSTDTIQITDITNKTKGEKVTVTGTSSFNQVIVKVLNPDGTVLYFDVVNTANGSYSKEFTLPADAQTGTYTVVVGKETTVAKDLFDVYVPIGGGGGGGGFFITEADKAVQDIKDGKWLALNDRGNLNLPAAAVDKLGDTKLKVKSGDLTVEIPAANIKSLIAGLSIEALKDATITVNIEKKQTADIESLISKAESAGQLVLTSAGEMIDITLSVSTKDGKTNKISRLTEPVTISFKLKAGANSKLAGIYSINDNGELEYVGGTVANSTIQAELQHFSLYGVLEYNKSFSDVPATHWAYDIIKELSAKHIVNGTTDALFMPENQVTRSEFVALLTRALQLKSTPIYNNTFADVSPNEWYASSVQSAVQAGLVTGTSETTFEPNKPITREEMVTLIVRAYEKNHGVQSAPSKSVSFTDASQIHDWAQPFVNKAANLGIIATDTAQFNPLDHATRAESSKVVSSILSK